MIKIELLIKTIKFFFNKKYYFLLPVKNQYVIINHIGKNLLERCIGENFYSIDITKSINIYIFFKTFFKCVIKKNFDPYIECYIDSISPIAVFCFTTNYIQFYRIKKNKNIKYIAIQNGVNLGNGQFQIYKKILQKKYYCDYMFCYGDFDKKLMGKVINAKFYKIGSFVGNMIKKNKNKVEKNISYISTYRNLKNDKYDKNSTIGKEIDFESFYSTEKIILNFLNNFCKKNKLKFRILGATQQSGHLKEFLFYKKIITGKGWLYVPKINFMSNYIETDYSTIVAFIDSSLGYESLARYNKTAAFCVRGQHLKIKGFQFSSGKLPKSGPFWSSTLDFKKFEKILNNLLKINRPQWTRIWGKFADRICKFDYGNKIFFKVLKENKLIKKNINYYFFN